LVSQIVRLNCKRNCQDWIVSRVSVELSIELSSPLVSVDLWVKLSVRYSPLVNSSLNRFIKFTTNIQIVRNYRVGNCIVLNCVEVANKICYIQKSTLVMASSRDDGSRRRVRTHLASHPEIHRTRAGRATQVPRKVRVATITPRWLLLSITLVVSGMRLFFVTLSLNTSETSNGISISTSAISLQVYKVREKKTDFKASGMNGY